MKVVCCKVKKFKTDNFKNFFDDEDVYDNDGHKTRSGSIFYPMSKFSPRSTIEKLKKSLSESKSTSQTQKNQAQYGPRYAPKTPVPATNKISCSNLSNEKNLDYYKILGEFRKKNTSLPRFESAIDTQEIYNHEKIFGNEKSDLRELVESFQTWTLRDKTTDSIVPPHKLSFSTQVSSNCSRGILKNKIKNKQTKNWITCIPRNKHCSEAGKRISYSSADYSCFSDSETEITSVSLKWRAFK